MLDTAQSNLIGYARVSTDDQDLSLQIGHVNTVRIWRRDWYTGLEQNEVTK
jgi:DNA invertase Pin-like site-specific DNA recombinase